MRVLMVGVMIGLLGCQQDAEVIETEGTESQLPSKADRGSDSDDLTFWYVDADRPVSETDANHIFNGMQVLADMANEGRGIRSDLAVLTLARIADGSVKVGSLATARGWDLWHICKDLEHAVCATGEPDDDWAGNADLIARLLDDLDGYMWGNHLYFAFGDSVDSRNLAGTLVHEVNHALNRSECSYYTDITAHKVDQTLAFIEEFRAFMTECYLDTPEADIKLCANYAADTVEDRGYDMTPDLAAVLPSGTYDVVELGDLILNHDEDAEFGVLLPTRDHWPTSFEPCR
jgi:hypothetical protein